MQLNCRSSPVALTKIPLRVFTPSSPFANFLSPIALRERSLANVPSQMLSHERSFVNVFSQTFFRERFIANDLFGTFPRKRSLHSYAHFASIPSQTLAQLRKDRGWQYLYRASVRYWTWLSNFALQCDEAFLLFAGLCHTG